MNSAKRWLGAAAVVVALSGMACTSGRSGSATGGTSDGLRDLESGGSTAQETLRPGVPSAQRGQYGEASGFQPGRLDPDWKVDQGATGAGAGGTMQNYTSSTTGYGAGGAAGAAMDTYTSSTRGYGAGGGMTNYTSSTRGYGAGGAMTNYTSSTGGAGAGGTAPCP